MNYSNHGITRRQATRLALATALAAAAAGAAWAQDDLADGEVRKVDAETAKITLKHGEIKSLDMPPMTMVFGVRDKALLAKVKPGDKVRFKAVNDNGRLTIVELQPLK